MGASCRNREDFAGRLLSGVRLSRDAVTLGEWRAIRCDSRGEVTSQPLGRCLFLSSRDKRARCRLSLATRLRYLGIHECN